MKLVVGLGNPDDKYKNTFHNLGFMAVDLVAQKLGVTFSKEKCKAQIAELKVGREKVIIAKPQTYMNLSGESVQELLSFFKIDVSDLLVIYDDFDLFKGAIRIRDKGSAGTHNGMKNIIALIGKENFSRIRVGFKPQGEFKIPLINYVLSGISKEDKDIFDGVLDTVSNAAVDFIKGLEIQKIMLKYNCKGNQ